MSMVQRFGLGALLLGSASCGSDPASFESTVEVAARVEPVRIHPGDSAAVVAVFHNKTGKPQTLGFAMGCPFYLRIVGPSGEGVPLNGSAYACLAVINFLEIAPRDSLVWKHLIEARVGGELPPAGNYKALLRSTGASPDLDAVFVIK